MPSFRELLAQTKASITEIDPERRRGAARRGRRSSTSASRTSTTPAPSPARSTSPAATSRARSRSKIPDQRHARSSSTAPAAPARRSRPRRSRQLGYTDVASMAGGFGQWKNEGRAVDHARGRSAPSSATATSATSSSPRSARPASSSCSSRKVLLLGAGGLGSPAALYLAAAGVGTLGIVDMDVVDASNLQRQILHNMDRIGERKVDSAKKTLTLLNPDVNVVTYDVRFGADNVLDIIDGYDVVARRHRQLPDALPAQRRVAAEADPGRARIDLPVRGSGHGVQALRGPVLPLPAPRAAAARARAELRGGRRARRAARHRRLDPGARDDQAPPRPRRPAHRPAPRVRRARAVVPHVQGAPRPDVPGLRRERGARS